MNDTVITAAFKRRELKIWAVCFVAAILVNAGSDSLVRDPLGRIVHTDRLCRCFIGPALCRCRRSAVGRVGREEVGLPQVQVG